MFFVATIFVSFRPEEKTTYSPIKKTRKKATMGGGGLYTEVQIENGKYLVEIMGCADCHAPKKMTIQGPIPDSDLGLSGHPANIPMGKVIKN